MRWAGFRCEGVECVGNGARCARLRHSTGPPGHFEPLWISNGVLSADPLRPLNVRPENAVEDGGVEVIPDAIVGICGDR